jgi:hypothetical protein
MQELMPNSLTAYERKLESIKEINIVRLNTSIIIDSYIKLLDESASVISSGVCSVNLLYSVFDAVMLSSKRLVIHINFFLKQFAGSISNVKKNKSEDFFLSYLNACKDQYRLIVETINDLKCVLNDK